MKILQMLFAMVFLLGLCGCGEIDDPAAAQPPEVIQEGEPMEITSFSFTHTGMSTDECFCYSVAQTEEGVRLYTEELFSGGFIVDTVIDEPILEQLGEMAGRYRLDRWDGFDKRDRNVLDGSRFSLSVSLADGSTISANGNNAFPDRYADAEQEIRALFEDLIDRYGNRYPKILESDELVSVSLTLQRKTNAGSERFELKADAPQEGRLSLTVWIDGYGEFWSDGEYYFDGECRSFPFDAIQQVVREYDIPTWNGWNKTVDGVYKEWIQMGLYYASGEEISVMGSRFPENYDAARDAILRILAEYIQENKGSLGRS